MRCFRSFILLVLSVGGVRDGGLLAGTTGDERGKSPRETVAITTGWRFQIDTHDIGEREQWYAAGLRPIELVAVEVPRAWDCFNEALRGYEGVGWYSVNLDGSWARSGKIQHLHSAG